LKTIIYGIKCRGQNMQNSIIIKGAKEHNLKDINLEIPRDKLVVITGLSGSRKIITCF
jgi:excinuclease ABC subunit A